MSLALKDRLNSVMIKENMNIRGLSKQSGVSESTISRILSGNIKFPNDKTINSISSILNIPKSFLSKYENKPIDCDHINHKSLSQRLRYLMNKSGVCDLVSLSIMTEVSHDTILNILKGKNERPSLETCENISKFFGISIKQLMCEEELDPNIFENSSTFLINIIPIDNFIEWISTENIKYICSYEKIVTEDNKDLFAIIMHNEKYVPEFGENDVLVFKKQNLYSSKSKYIITYKNITYVAYIDKKYDYYNVKMSSLSSEISLREDEFKIYGILIQVRYK